MTNSVEIAEKLTEGVELNDHSVEIQCSGCNVVIRSNSEALLAKLAQYFVAYIKPQADAIHTISVIAIEGEEPKLAFSWADWAREPGKTGRKDSFYPLLDGRLIRKVRTGMVFLQSQEHCIAVGPCVTNDNQVINFINSQVMNWLQQNRWLICHAAGLVREGKGLGIAGFSGGGKSTLMLKLMLDSRFHYLTNDRLFILQDHGACTACGIAKLPRVNPGTMLYHPLLKSLLSKQKQNELQALQSETLWDLEEKHDVQIDEVFGKGRLIADSVTLKDFVILNWKRDTDVATSLEPVEIATRPDLMAALMKSPGPFFQDSEGRFLTNGHQPESDPYPAYLNGVTVWEMTGKTDFESAAALIDSKIYG